MNLIKVSELFDIKYGNGLSLQECKLDTYGVPFISRGSYNNGIVEYVGNIQGVALNPANTITVAVGGSVMESFLQRQPYYTGYHILILSPKKEMTDAEMLYYCTCLRANKYKYNYGRQANKTLKDILIPAPADIPNWVSTTTITPPPSTPLQNKETPRLDTSTWKAFRYDEIFDIRKGRRLTKENMQSGNVPFIGATEMYNGITAYTDTAIFPKKSISVSYNGSVAEAFFHEYEYWGSDDIHCLTVKGVELGKYLAIFLCSIIKMEKYRFNYGRKWNMDRMKQSIIRFPVDSRGNPDWQFMENYIKTLPYSGAI